MLESVKASSTWLIVILNEFGSTHQHLGSNEKQVESSEGGHDFSKTI